MDVMDMTWVWTDEVAAVVTRRMLIDGISAGELARRAGERFSVRPESFERRLRAAQSATGVMKVHTADALLVMVGCHLTDLPCYRAAMLGELPPDGWPRRGRHRRPAGLSDVTTQVSAPRSPRRSARSFGRPSPVAAL